MKENYTSCNFLYPDVISASVPFNPLSVRIKCFLLYDAIPFIRTILHLKKSGKGTTSEHDTLNLQPGEWVEVRSIDEISVTLDEKGKYKGLYFMPDMEKFCGKKFKVLKRADIIKLEQTGEVRKLKNPSIFLEGIYCDGKGRNKGCERSCFHFWREAWLKRLPDKSL